MKISGIVCEYNPFHNGHMYHIEETRKNGATHIVAVMSGNFVQRGDLAVADKFRRAETAVNCGAGHDMVATRADIEHGVEVCRLAGAGQHSCRATLHRCDLGCHHIAGGVLQAGIEITGGLQVKELAHILGGCILKSRALYNGELAGFAISGSIAGLNGQCFHTQFLFHNGHLMVRIYGNIVLPHRSFVNQ